MRISDTVTLAQVLAAHAEMYAEYSSGKITWNTFIADARRADLTDADLTRADLTRANLTGADLTGANLPTIVKVENIDARILAAVESGGTLKMDSWHTCETTHCRAGWAITLAGDGGRVLEDIYGSAVAGALIYAASRPSKPIPNFYQNTASAMASIRADAAEAGGAP